MFAPGPSCCKSCCKSCWWQKRFAVPTCQEANSEVQLRFPWQAVLGGTQNSDLATLCSGQFPSEQVVVHSFSEQFCESKAFEIEGGENLSVAVRIEFRAMSFNALPFPVISFVLCPRSSAPNRLRRKKVPRSPRSSAEASRLEVGLASVHVSVDASKPFTFFAHCYFAPRGLRQHDSCDKVFGFDKGCLCGWLSISSSIEPKVVHCHFLANCRI